MNDNKPSDDAIFNQLDQDKLKQEIKAEAVKEAQDTLISRLQGDSSDKRIWEKEGRKSAADYDEFEKQYDGRYVKKEEIEAEASKIVEKKLKDKEDADLKKQEESRTKQADVVKQKRESFDKEWYSLVQEGKMPAPAKELQERINKGESLTKEEILGDEGLKARLELTKLSQNKSAKLAYYEDFNKPQAGTTAPVFGARPSAPHKENKELEYEDVAKNRKRLFGF